MRAVLLTIFFIALTACSSGEDKSSEFIPDIQALCSASQAADCGGSGLNVFAGLTDSLPSDCDDFLTGLDSTQRRRNFVASSTALATHNGTFLDATFSSWLGDHGGAVDVLEPGAYVVCAFIDTNGNDLIDVHEPVGTGSVTVGTTGFILNVWAPAFN